METTSILDLYVWAYRQMLFSSLDKEAPLLLYTEVNAETQGSSRRISASESLDIKRALILPCARLREHHRRRFWQTAKLDDKERGCEMLFLGHAHMISQ